MTNEQMIEHIVEQVERKAEALAAERVAAAQAAE
jgi:hypothetical protein